MNFCFSCCLFFHTWLCDTEGIIVAFNLLEHSPILLTMSIIHYLNCKIIKYNSSAKHSTELFPSTSRLKIFNFILGGAIFPLLSHFPKHCDEQWSSFSYFSYFNCDNSFFISGYFNGFITLWRIFKGKNAMDEVYQMKYGGRNRCYFFTSIKGGFNFLFTNISVLSKIKLRLSSCKIKCLKILWSRMDNLKKSIVVYSESNKFVLIGSEKKKLFIYPCLWFCL